MMNAIEIKNVSYTYSKGTPFEKRALNDVSVSFKKGIITGLMGHTGCGKSTLVSLFNGLTKPDSGIVNILGNDLWAKPKEMTKYRFKVGVVFQYPEYQLFGETVKEDIAFGPKNMKLEPSEIDKRVKEAAKICSVDDDILSKSPFDLSGGQKRRVAIAGIMAMKPEILVLDEPAAGLDPKTRESVFELILNYRDTYNATIIIVSHSMEDMAKYSDEIIVMKDAGIYMQGSKEEIFSHPQELCALGLDVPPITYLSKKLAAMGIPIKDNCFTVELARDEILKAIKG